MQIEKVDIAHPAVFVLYPQDTAASGQLHRARGHVFKHIPVLIVGLFRIHHGTGLFRPVDRDGYRVLRGSDPRGGQHKAVASGLLHIKEILRPVPGLVGVCKAYALAVSVGSDYTEFIRKPLRLYFGGS